MVVRLHIDCSRSTILSPSCYREKQDDTSVIDEVRIALGSAALKLPPRVVPPSPLRLVPPPIEPPPLRPMPVHVALMVVVGAYEIYRHYELSHTPIVDKPPEGKGVMQWLAEIEETTRIAILIANKQIEISRHNQNGDEHLARIAKAELSQLTAYVQTIASGMGSPMTQGGLKSVASAEGVPSGNGPVSSNAQSQKDKRPGIVLPLQMFQSIANPSGTLRVSEAYRMFGTQRMPISQTLFSSAVDEIWHSLDPASQLILSRRFLNPRVALPVNAVMAQLGISNEDDFKLKERDAIRQLLQQLRQAHIETLIQEGNPARVTNYFYYIPFSDAAQWQTLPAPVPVVQVPVFAATVPALSSSAALPQSGDPRARYHHEFRSLPVEERLRIARETMEEGVLSALCYDPESSVIHAVLENAHSGLAQARLIAAHHGTSAGLEFLGQKAQLMQDGQVRHMLFRNPQSPEALLRRVMQSLTLQGLFTLVNSREQSERSQRLSNEIYRHKFNAADVVDRVNFIVSTEGNCLAKLEGERFDAEMVKELMSRTYVSIPLIRSLALFSGSPRRVLQYLLNQSALKSRPALRNEITAWMRSRWDLQRGL